LISSANRRLRHDPRHSIHWSSFPGQLSKRGSGTKASDRRSHPMSKRFYLPSISAEPTARLGGGEAHHLSRVLRLQPGDLVTLFDGQGSEAQARIDCIDGENVELSIQSRTTDDSPGRLVTLATAVPKGERFDWLVEKAVELGVHRLIPLVTERSVVKPGDGK